MEKSALLKILKGLLISQILLYAWNVQILLSTRGSNSFEGLLSFVPFYLFLGLLPFTIFMEVSYIYMVRKKRLKRDNHSEVLSLIVLAAIVYYPMFLDWYFALPLNRTF